MPKRVDPIHNPDDQEALYAAAMGRSNKFILGETALTDSQIGYRLKKDGIKRMDARNGETPFSKMIYRMGREVWLTMVLRKLRKKYENPKPSTKKPQVPVGNKRRKRVAQ